MTWSSPIRYTCCNWTQNNWHTRVEEGKVPEGFDNAEVNPYTSFTLRLGALGVFFGPVEVVGSEESTKRTIVEPPITLVVTLLSSVGFSILAGLLVRETKKMLRIFLSFLRYKNSEILNFSSVSRSVYPFF